MPNACAALTALVARLAPSDRAVAGSYDIFGVRVPHGACLSSSMGMRCQPLLVWLVTQEAVRLGWAQERLEPLM